MKKIIKAIENDLFGHESWIVIGNEQHKKFWYALVGDCSSINEAFEFFEFPTTDAIKEFRVSLPKITLQDKTFSGLIKKLNKEIK